MPKDTGYGKTTYLTIGGTRYHRATNSHAIRGLAHVPVFMTLYQARRSLTRSGRLYEPCARCYP